MGTWSTNLFGNDTSCDVRDTYIKHLQNQLSDEEAEAKMMEEYERDFARDEDEQPLFWYALAATEWKVGRLSEKVKAEALSWIDRQGGSDLWDAENLLEANPVKAEAQSREKKEKWLNNLAKLKETLRSPQPRRRGFRPPEVVIKDRWNVGDLYAYRLHPELSPKWKEKHGVTEIVEKLGLVGKFMLLQKIGVRSGVMDICVYRPLFDSIPSDCTVLEHTELLPLQWPSLRSMELFLHFRMWAIFSNKEYPEGNLFFVGNAPLPKPFTEGKYAWNRPSTGSWLRLSSTLADHYHWWDGLRYEYRDGLPYWDADNDQPLWPTRQAEMEEVKRQRDEMRRKR